MPPNNWKTVENEFNPITGSGIIAICTSGANYGHTRASGLGASIRLSIGIR